MYIYIYIYIYTCILSWEYDQHVATCGIMLTITESQLSYYY